MTMFKLTCFLSKQETKGLVIYIYISYVDLVNIIQDAMFKSYRCLFIC